MIKGINHVGVVVKSVGKVFEGSFRVAFLHPKSARGVLYELTDTPSLG